MEKPGGPEHQTVGGAEFEDVGRARLGMPFWGELKHFPGGLRSHWGMRGGGGDCAESHLRFLTLDHQQPPISPAGAVGSHLIFPLNISGTRCPCSGPQTL